MELKQTLFFFSRVRRLNDKMGYGQGSFQMGAAESKGETSERVYLPNH